MKKRLLSMLMAVLMIVSLVPAVSAADATCAHDKANVTVIDIKADAAAKQPAIKVSVCNKCGEVTSALSVTAFADVQDICAKHTYKTVELQAASCGKVSIAVTYCANCGTVATTKALTIGEVKDAAHVYTNFTVVKAPSCGTDGWGYTVCDKCGEPAFVAGPSDAVAKLGENPTAAAVKAVRAQFTRTNQANGVHADKDAFVTVAEDVYGLTYVENADGVGFVKYVLQMAAAVAPTHSATVSGKVVRENIVADGNTVNPWCNYVKTEGGNGDDPYKITVVGPNNVSMTGHGVGYTGDKYCPDCKAVEYGKCVNGLNYDHSAYMNLEKTGYYPYIDAAGVKHNGVTDTWHCTKCNTTFGGETLAFDVYFNHQLNANRLPTVGMEIGDTWTGVGKAATCEDDGYTAPVYQYVSKDGSKDTASWQILTGSQKIDKLGHQLMKVDSKDATCTEAGWTCNSYYVCTRVVNKQTCPYTQGVVTATLNKASHNYAVKTLVEPTCKNTGLAVSACTVCGDYELNKDGTPVVYGADKLKVIPCTAGEPVNAKEATCTEAGYTGDLYCKFCNKLLENGKEIPMVDHTAVDVEAVAPTCTEAGATAGTKCSVCDKVLSGCEAVDALGHTFDKGVCTVCGAEDPDYVAPVAPEFTDAKDIAPYAGDAVAWAVANGIVNGRDDGSFDPKANVTRAELVVMLWRQAGEPESTAKVEFTDAADIPEYAVKAVAWAVEKGIVTGYEDNTFKPTADVTRAEFVKMLYGMVGTKVETAADFSDVVAGEWYVDAINWAAAEEVTTGRDDGTFGVADNATREEAVTFLYRAFAE